MNVYFISGLGADQRAFEKISLPAPFSIHHLSWIKHVRGESLELYARRLAGGIDTSQPYAIVGLSMGGMLASTMSTFLEPDKTVLISSVACQAEFPPLFRWARRTRIYQPVPAFLFRCPNPVAYWLFGAKSRNEKRIMAYIISQSDAEFVKWSIAAIVNWKMQQRPKNLYQIHGDNDRILPIQYTKPDAVVKGGSHFMVWTKAAEVSRLLTDALSDVNQNNT